MADDYRFSAKTNFRYESEHFLQSTSTQNCRLGRVGSAIVVNEGA
jgi:hypothetical protein